MTYVRHGRYRERDQDCIRRLHYFSLSVVFFVISDFFLLTSTSSDESAESLQTDHYQTICYCRKQKTFALQSSSCWFPSKQDLHASDSFLLVISGLFCSGSISIRGKIAACSKQHWLVSLWKHRCPGDEVPFVSRKHKR